jgi:hypothetical protein
MSPVHLGARSHIWRSTALGLSPPVDEKPLPIREVIRVPVDDEGREIQAS